MGKSKSASTSFFLIVLILKVMTFIKRVMTSIPFVLIACSTFQRTCLSVPDSF